MLQSSLLELNRAWDDRLHMIEFTYNNNYQSSIQMAHFEVLYERHYCTTLFWLEVGKRVLLGPELVQYVEETARIVRDKLRTGPASPYSIFPSRPSRALIPTRAARSRALADRNGRPSGRCSPELRPSLGKRLEVFSWSLIIVLRAPLSLSPPQPRSSPLPLSPKTKGHPQVILGVRFSEQAALANSCTSAYSDLEKKNESSRGNLPNLSSNECSVNLDNSQSMNSSLSAAEMMSIAEINGTEVGNAEVEYVETESLIDLPSVDVTLNTLMVRLDSKDWVSVCEALNNVRQLSVYHKEKLIDLLGDLIAKIAKSLKNPRSAVCKTAIMTCGDIFKVYNDSVIDFLDPLLVQLLLKASQDKRFVCEASEIALIAMTTWISPTLLLPKLQSYLKNRNPRIRAKASMCFSRSVPRLGVEGIKVYGINNLIQIAASQLSDQLPESREAARSLALELQNLYEKTQLSSGDASSIISWEAFCNAELSALSAQAILRVTSIQKDGGVGSPTQNS